MPNATSKLLWIRFLLVNLKVSLPSAMSFFSDNQAALHIALNLDVHEHIKHIKIDYRFIHDRLLNIELHTSYVSSRDLDGDHFIKAL